MVLSGSIRNNWHVARIKPIRRMEHVIYSKYIASIASSRNESTSVLAINKQIERLQQPSPSLLCLCHLCFPAMYGYLHSLVHAYCRRRRRVCLQVTFDDSGEAQLERNIDAQAGAITTILRKAEVGQLASGPIAVWLSMHSQH